MKQYLQDDAVYNMFGRGISADNIFIVIRLLFPSAPGGRGFYFRLTASPHNLILRFAKEFNEAIMNLSPVLDRYCSMMLARACGWDEAN